MRPRTPHPDLRQMVLLSILECTSSMLPCSCLGTHPLQRWMKYLRCPDENKLLPLDTNTSCSLSAVDVSSFRSAQNLSLPTV